MRSGPRPAQSYIQNVFAGTQTCFLRVGEVYLCSKLQSPLNLLQQRSASAKPIEERIEAERHVGENLRLGESPSRAARER